MPIEVIKIDPKAVVGTDSRPDVDGGNSEKPIKIVDLDSKEEGERKRKRKGKIKSEKKVKKEPGPTSWRGYFLGDPTHTDLWLGVAGFFGYTRSAFNMVKEVLLILFLLYIPIKVQLKPSCCGSER